MTFLHVVVAVRSPPSRPLRANMMKDNDSFSSSLSFSIFSPLSFAVPCGICFILSVSEENKSNNKKNSSSSSSRDAIYLNSVYIHIHIEQNRFLLQTKETFLLRPPSRFAGSSPRNFINQCTHTNQDVTTTTISNRTNEELKKKKIKKKNNNK